MAKIVDLPLRNKVETKTKACKTCGLKKQMSHFYTTNDPETFPDGKYHTCSTCMRNKIDENDLKSVHALLAELNKPFITALWKRALKSQNLTMTEYLRGINTNKTYQTLTYIDGDATLRMTEEEETVLPHTYDKNGYIISLTDDVKNRWLKRNRDFSDLDILKLEEFCVNMSYDYNIDTTSQESMLQELSILNLEKQKLLNAGDYTSYKKVADASKSILQDAGFRPIDKKDDDKQKGLDSLGEIIAHLERDNGFITPNRINYPPDDIDRMLTYYIRWAQKFQNQSVDVEINPHWRDGIDDDDIQFEIDVAENEKDDI